MTAFGVVPQSRSLPVQPVVKAIDREAPLRAKPAYSDWSDAERQVLRERAHLGSRGIQKVLPHRSIDAIRGEAGYLNIKITLRRRQGVKYAARRANKPVPENRHPLIKAIVAEIAARGMTYQEADKAAGLAGGTIRGWVQSNVPRLDTLEAALNMLGFELLAVKRGDKAR